MSADRHPRPHDAALLEAELVLLGLADDRRVELAPDRGRAQMLGADHVAFLVDQRADDEPAVERDAAALDRRRRHHPRRQAALHVGGAAPVDSAVDEIGAEGRMRPFGGVALGHDVGVTLEQKALAAPLLTEPRDDVRASWSDLLDLELEPLLDEPRLDVTGDRFLAGARL